MRSSMPLAITNSYAYQPWQYVCREVDAIPVVHGIESHHRVGKLDVCTLLLGDGAIPHHGQPPSARPYWSQRLSKSLSGAVQPRGNLAHVGRVPERPGIWFAQKPPLHSSTSWNTLADVKTGSYGVSAATHSSMTILPPPFLHTGNTLIVTTLEGSSLLPPG